MRVEETQQQGEDDRRGQERGTGAVGHDAADVHGGEPEGGFEDEFPVGGLDGIDEVLEGTVHGMIEWWGGLGCLDLKKQEAPAGLRSLPVEREPSGDYSIYHDTLAP